ncbi:MAG: hypothetical protein E7163_04720 [Firmicutes bacterium]|nr:hypothetical protein [Bacillota bacterium]
MKRSIIKSLFFIFVFFCLTMHVSASSKYVVLQDAVNIRSGPGTSYQVHTVAKIGSKYYLKNENLNNIGDTDCTLGWYEINFNGSSAYVCSEYVKVNDYNVIDNVEPQNACEIELKSKGFTSSYFVPLCKLKEKYPEWNFVPIMTGLDFNVVVTQESKCGKSYVETNDPNYIDSSCKSVYSPTSIWKPASTGAVKYYIDPRNFLDEKSIFMFETLSYVNELESVYSTAIEAVLKKAAFYSYHANIGNNLGDIINSVGKSLNVSPIFTASRIYQEIGASTNSYDLYSGVYPGYEGYYNFYNYGVSDSCAQVSVAVCGLEYAKSKNWYGLEAAINAGVKSISEGYINVGQNTRYLQKFNIAPFDINKLYTHQYMTNIRAPYGEASTAYNSYSKSESLNNNFTFSIPVFENMPAFTELPNDNEDNNSSGAVDNEQNKEPNVVDIAPKTVITTAGYKHSNNKILGIKPETNAEAIKSSLESVSGNSSVIIKNSKDEEVSNDTKIGTGYKITIKGSTEETFEVVIYGDVSGDGNIGPLDLLLVRRELLKTENLSGSYELAADPNKDNNITALDLLLVQRHILKAESIEQG